MQGAEPLGKNSGKLCDIAKKKKKRGGGGIAENCEKLRTSIPPPPVLRGRPARPDDAQHCRTPARPYRHTEHRRIGNRCWLKALLMGHGSGKGHKGQNEPANRCWLPSNRRRLPSKPPGSGPARCLCGCARPISGPQSLCPRHRRGRDATQIDNTTQLLDPSTPAPQRTSDCGRWAISYRQLTAQLPTVDCAPPQNWWFLRTKSV